MEVQAPVHVLHFVSGKYAGTDFPLVGDAFVAGRSSEVDLILADDAVSRKHARFYKQRGLMFVRDLGSRNGTIVNGEAVRHRCLRTGDRIVLGASLCRVESRHPNELTAPRAGEDRRRRLHEASGRSMSGNIDQIPLMDVLQWLATSRKTGVLKVRSTYARRDGGLHLRDGRVVFAAIEGTEVSPEKALMRMLTWPEGMFEFESTGSESSGPSALEMSLEHVLMEAARQKDELAELEKRTPLPGPRDNVKLTRPSPMRWRDLDTDDLDFLQEMVEVGGWQAMLDRSKRDDLSLYRGIVALREKGVVEY